MPRVDVETIVKNNQPTECEKRQVEEFASRKAKARFYADENFPVRAIAIVRQWNADVVTAQQSGLRGHPDENHLAKARRLGRVLITCDRNYLNERRFPLISCPAIVVCDFGQGTESEIRKTLMCLGTIFEVPQFFDKWTKIDAMRGSWRVYSRHLDGTTARSRYRYHRGSLQEWVES